jgi:hypothetical protein
MKAKSKSVAAHKITVAPKRYGCYDILDNGDYVGWFGDDGRIYTYIYMTSSYLKKLHLPHDSAYFTVWARESTSIQELTDWIVGELGAENEG